jgi:hypothetical protein
MKLIPLTQELFAQVDDEDFKYLNQWKWYAHRDGKTYYARRQISTKGIRKMLRMHREIMNTPESMEVDHRDHNGLNNQKSNLRNCTRRQNGYNLPARGKSKYLGVYYTKYSVINMAIMVNNKRIYKCSFPTEEAAAREYDRLAKKYFGKFANLNFKDE